MGVGGLLKEIETRPLPRAEAAIALARPAPRPKDRRPGAGRRPQPPDGPLNKLLVADDQGVPMVARVVDNALASRARPVVVVTGYERERVERRSAARR